VRVVRWTTPAALAGAVLVAACGEHSAPAAPPAASHFLAPADGDTVGSEFVLRLGVTGVRAVPADGMQRDGEGHHHVFVDADLTPADSVIPKTADIFHIGSGADSLRIAGLDPGRHRIITRFAYGNHLPMPGVATDTIWVTVE